MIKLNRKKICTSCFEALFSYLQWTEIGPSWPNCSFVLCTWPMKSINPSPDFGTPCSGQSVNWNCLTVRDWPSFNRRHKQYIPKEYYSGWKPVSQQPKKTIKKKRTLGGNERWSWSQLWRLLQSQYLLMILDTVAWTFINYNII